MLAIRAHWRALTVLMIALVAVLCGVLLVQSAVRGPSERHNPSFRYGEQIMRKLYGSPDGSGEPVKHRCARAIDAATDHPQPFDRAEAIAGCTYLEYRYDN